MFTQELDKGLLGLQGYTSIDDVSEWELSLIEDSRIDIILEVLTS